jgi:mannose-6-phosphate isomerase-like protein (cupin superfamily)
VDLPFRSAKAAIVKSQQAIGGHYHRKKDEVFLLLSGRAVKVVLGNDVSMNVNAPFRWAVPAGVWHEFTLEPESVLLGVATQPFDPEDEIMEDPR